VYLYTRIAETTGDRLAGERYNVARPPCPKYRDSFLCHQILCIWTRPDNPSILRCGSSVAAQRVHKPRSGRVRSNMTRPHADITSFLSHMRTILWTRARLAGNIQLLNASSWSGPCISEMPVHCLDCSLALIGGFNHVPDTGCPRQGQEGKQAGTATAQQLMLAGMTMEGERGRYKQRQTTYSGGGSGRRERVRYK
jgi:hypothetical protein